MDDETIVCSEFSRILRMFGFQALAAQTSEAALRLARKARFDLILLEFNLRSERGTYPRAGNGLNLLRKLRGEEIASPLLIFTVMEGELYETASLDAGADDFIPKATPFPILISRLHAHIRRCGLHKNKERKRKPSDRGQARLGNVGKSGRSGQRRRPKRSAMITTGSS